MNRCLFCGADLDGNTLVCPRCGKSLGSTTVASLGQTVNLKGPILPPAPAGGLGRAVRVDVLFGGKDRLLIGRGGDCDICLPHPTVSRKHAILERLPDGKIRLRDLDSVNGVCVAGRRITDEIIIHERERIGIGPYLFGMVDGVIYTLDSSKSLRLEARDLERAVPVSGGHVRKLIEGISLAVEPGEFVSLIGPSGSGKSTLMDALNGRRRATGGQVLANGEDFYRHFDNFRQSLGYVPQRDIVHTQLTVYRALYYTARLRLPTDTTPSELEDRIETVLHEMELDAHRDTLIAHLSGGQIKRVSLGAELLARPCMLYVDEATSGLDAGTEARMMGLFRRLADEGRSILCITHNVDNVDRCHLVLVLAAGKLVFYGPPAEALGYFGVPRISLIYDRLGERMLAEWEEQFRGSKFFHEYVEKRLTPAVPQGTEEPNGFAALGVEWISNVTKLVGVDAKPLLAGKAAEAPPPPSAPPAVPPRPPHPPMWHQFRVLTARYSELLLGDRRTALLLFLQAPVVALFLLVGFLNKPYHQEVPRPRPLEPSERETLQLVKDVQDSLKERGLTPAERLKLQLFKFPIRGGQKQVTGEEATAALTKLRESGMVDRLLEQEGSIVPDGTMINPRYTYMLLFILVIAVLWFGCNNAAKEIVKEEAIYGRERAVNLGLLPYLASKFLVLSAITALQVALLMLVTYGSLWACQEWLGWPMPYREQYLAYLPQYGVLVLLGMTSVAMGLMLSACVSTPDRASTLLPYVLIPQIILSGGVLGVNDDPLRALAWVASPLYWAYRAVHLGANDMPQDFPMWVNYPDGLALPCAALGIQMGVMLVATAWFLWRKDVR